MSLVENQDAGWYTILRNEYRLPPTSNLLRLLIQQSNCFVVVERSMAGMGAMNRERAIMQSGEMRGGSNFGQGPDGGVGLRAVAGDHLLQQRRGRHRRCAGRAHRWRRRPGDRRAGRSAEDARGQRDADAGGQPLGRAGVGVGGQRVQERLRGLRRPVRGARPGAASGAIRTPRKARC